MRNRSKFLSATVAVALILALANAAVVPLSAASLPEMEAQRTGGGQASAANTQVVVNGGIVNVTYDLQGPEAQTFEVALEASQDGGKTYGIRPMTVSGDVGRGVRPGTGKRIVWDAAKDTDNLQLGELRFRVALKPEAAQTTAPPPPRTAPPPQDRRAVNPPDSGRQRRSLLPALALVGGGVAFGALGLRGAPLAKDSEATNQCADDGFGRDLCRDVFGTSPNQAVVGLGLGIAATGVILMFVGRGRAASIPVVVPLRKGVGISKTVRF